MTVTASDLKTRFPQLQGELVEKIAVQGDWKTFAPGDYLMRKGQYLRSAILVVDGLVKLYREDDEGSEFFVYYLEGGQACALSMAFAANQGVSELTARAVGETTVILVPLDWMEKWMMEYKSWYQFVLASYRSRFEELLETIDHIAFRNMDERLIHYLKRHRDKTKSPHVYLSNTQIAQDLNSSREVISRLVKKLADRGILLMHRNHFELVDLDGAWGLPG